MLSKKKNGRAVPRVGRVALALSAALALAPAPLLAATAFDYLIGNWRGEGHVVFEGGKEERLTCNSYYGEKDSGKQLTLVIRCANPASGKIEMRGLLNYQDGMLTGTWEERTYNATGTATGSIIDNQVHLSFEGAVNGTLTTLVTHDTQSIFIRSRGSGLSTVNITMRRQ